MATSNQGGNKGGDASERDDDSKSRSGASHSGKQEGNQGSERGGSSQSDTSNRGFASMDPDKQREIAAEGGRAAHASGNAHEFTTEEAREAGSMSHKGSGSQQSDSSSGGSSQTGSGGSQGSSGGSQGSSGSKGSSSDSGSRSSSSSSGSGGKSSGSGSR